MDGLEHGGAPGVEPDHRVERFTVLFRRHVDEVRRFARRRVGADRGDEITAATFLIAWRRLDSVPEPALPWLYRVAAYEIANLRRKEVARDRAHKALAVQITRESDRQDDGRDERTDVVRAAYWHLRASDREALRLVAWEELDPAEAAQVLGCSAATFRVRLHRARRRLSKDIEMRMRARDRRDLGSEQSSASGESVDRPDEVVHDGQA